MKKQRPKRAQKESDNMNLTFDETNVLCIYAGETKEDTVTALKEMREALSDEDAELREITDSVLTKLEGMTEEDFSKLELYPDFDE